MGRALGLFLDAEGLRASGLKFQEVGESMDDLGVLAVLGEEVAASLPGSAVAESCWGVEHALQAALRSEGEWPQRVAVELLAACSGIEQCDEANAVELGVDRTKGV